MIHFQDIDLSTFLRDYWQKKPVVLRNALTDFQSLITGDELAGLALDEAIESRIVIESDGRWDLKKGPFDETIFAELPKTHWTLLVQGVDRIMPEIANKVDHFNFIPRWRFDDVMISYAAKGGNVGPHYDLYDVFLLQASGQREWSLTSKQCHEHNCVSDSALRIMDEFDTEESYVLNEGDILYIPPHIGHHGIALTDDCITYSFGYRSYQSKELLDSFAQYIGETTIDSVYRDPDWQTLAGSGEINNESLQRAQQCLRELIEDPELIRTWFGRHVTQLDSEAEKFLDLPIEESELPSLDAFQKLLNAHDTLSRDPICRIAYSEKGSDIELYVNGCLWDTSDVSTQLLKQLANHTALATSDLILVSDADRQLILDFWRLRWLVLA